MPARTTISSLDTASTAAISTTALPLKTDIRPPDDSDTSSFAATETESEDTDTTPPLKISSVSDTTDTRADDASNRSLDPTLTVLPATLTVSPLWTSMRPLVASVSASVLTTTLSPVTTSNILAAVMATFPASTTTPKWNTHSLQPTKLGLLYGHAPRRTATTSCCSKRMCRPSIENVPAPMFEPHTRRHSAPAPEPSRSMCTFVSPLPIVSAPPCRRLRMITSSTFEISGTVFSYSSKDPDERHTNCVYSIVPSPVSSTNDPVLPTRTLSEPVTSTVAAAPAMRSPPSITTPPPTTVTPTPNVALPAPPTRDTTPASTEAVMLPASTLATPSAETSALFAATLTCCAACTLAVTAPAESSVVVRSSC